MSKKIVSAFVTGTEEAAGPEQDRAETQAALNAARENLARLGDQLNEIRAALERAQAMRVLIDGMSERLCHLTLLGSVEATHLGRNGQALLPLVEGLKGLAEQGIVASRAPTFEPAVRQLLDAAETTAASLAALEKATNPAPARPTVIIVPPTSTAIQLAGRLTSDESDDRLWTKVLPRTGGSN